MPGFALKSDLYTLADYQTWPDSERWELIDGIAYMMSPAPSRGHQDLAGELFFMLRDYLKGKPCKPVISPYDVKFDNKTVVQPDISVWCARNDGRQDAVSSDGSSQIRNSEKQDAASAADEELSVVIEVLSPSTASYDMIEKLALYERQGVPEYWVVSPGEKRLIRFSLNEGKYAASYYDGGEFKSEKLAGFSFDVEAYFKSAAE